MCVFLSFISSVLPLFMYQRATVCEPAEQTPGQRHPESDPGHQPEGHQQGLLLVRLTSLRVCKSESTLLFNLRLTSTKRQIKMLWTTAPQQPCQFCAVFDEGNAGAIETRCKSRRSSSSRGVCLYNFDTKTYFMSNSHHENNCVSSGCIDLVMSSVTVLTLKRNHAWWLCVAVWLALPTPPWLQMRLQTTSRQPSKHWWPKYRWWVC